MRAQAFTGMLFAAFALPSATAAQGWIDGPVREVPDAAPFPVIRISSTVRITVQGRIARYEVEELFRNQGPRIAEGSYLYPMPGEAVFTDFSLFQGDQELKGEMLDAEQARGIYEAIVRKLRDPALLSLAGHGLVRAQVFPIQPGETRKVILRYTQVLEREGQAYRLRYPLGARGGGPVTIVATTPDEDRFGTPYSPTHRVTVGEEHRRLSARVEAEPRGTLELFFPIRTGEIGLDLFSHAPGGDDRFFMLVLSPGRTPPAAVAPRDLTLVVDVSGSMAGAKLDQAKAALDQALGSLRSVDRFRLITFSNAVAEFREGFAGADRGTVEEARRYVDGLVGRGGTNIEGALRAALGTGTSRGRIGIMLFLTDGLPSVGEQSPERLAAEAAARLGNTRIFPIGVGHDVNTYLLDRLAVDGRGRVEYVAPGQSVETAMGSVLQRVDAPALVDLRVVRAPVELVEIAPGVLPDLYYGDDLVVFGRYRGAGTGELVIEGERNGRRERYATRAVFAAHSRDHDYIPPLWAARRVGELTREARLEGATPERIARIRELGLRYGILTEHTSYLVKEPEQVAAAPRLDNIAAPAAQTGRSAAQRAARSAELSGSTSLEEVVVTAAKALNDEHDAAGAGRLVGGRIFVRREGRWTDLSHVDSVRVVSVAPYSPAYFALVRALPELVPWLAVGDDVTVAGRRVSIRIAAEGRTDWAAGELDSLVRRFRSR